MNDYLQVTNVNPLEGAEKLKGLKKVYNNIFSVGDCCLTKANEEKTVVPAKTCAEICANNIKSLTEGNANKMKKIPDKFPCIYGITLGSQKGIYVFNNYTKVNKAAAEMKAAY